MSSPKHQLFAKVNYKTYSSKNNVPILFKGMRGNFHKTDFACSASWRTTLKCQLSEKINHRTFLHEYRAKIAHSCGSNICAAINPLRSRLRAFMYYEHPLRKNSCFFAEIYHKTFFRKCNISIPFRYYTRRREFPQTFLSSSAL